MTMWPFSTSSKSYQPLKNENESENEIEEGESPDLDDVPEITPARGWHTVSLVLLLLSAVMLIIISIIFEHPPLPSQSSPPPDSSSPPPSSSSSSSSTDPKCPTRRAWHTLNPAEKAHYISSVLCLSTLPSALANHPNSTLHEDFPWIHAHVGYSTHHSAQFLPWHRYFLHIYDATLRTHCNFTGQLPYWDWTHNWQDLPHSAVFDPATGFGGDGDPDGNITVGNAGRCVIDGPFTHIHATYYDVRYAPHCLSRGFRDDAGTRGVIDGRPIRPQSIEEVLQLRGYADFVAEMESRVHDAIPFGVGGDFETFTAPYDPLFFLHHAQLDRLWWLWQRRDWGARRLEYAGHAKKHSMEMARLTDPIKMGGLSGQIAVREMMDPEEVGGMLCYRY